MKTPSTATFKKAKSIINYYPKELQNDSEDDNTGKSESEDPSLRFSKRAEQK